MSIFHRMKKAVVGTKQEAGTASLCPEYDAVRGDFEALHDVMIRIRQHLLTYREANSRMWTSATSLSSEFANMLEASAGDGDHPYTAMASTLKTSHAQLPAEREKLDTMLNACLFPLKEQLAKYEELKVRMQEHDKQKDEVVYYQGKVTGLRTAREQSKKPESATDREKYERNVKKMMDQEAAFHSMDSQLTAELRYAFEHRVAVLGPIMLAFVCAEREIASRYTQAINEVKLVDVNEANAWLAKHEAAMAAKAVYVSTASSTKTVTTDLQSGSTSSVIVNTASTAPNVTIVPDLMGSAALASVSSTGVVISEPQFAATNGRSSSSVADPFAAPQLQSPRSPGTFDNFEPSFSNAPSAFTDPFYSIPSATSTTTASSTEPLTATTTSTPTESTTTAATTDTAEVDGVPYTIGSSATHTAPSVTSAATTAPAAATALPTVNGTSSDFPVESSSLATSSSSTSSDLPTTAVVMDDMALEKTSGVEQLDGVHGGVVSSVEKTEKTEVDATEPYAGSGVGEKVDMFAPTTTDSPSVV